MSALSQTRIPCVMMRGGTSKGPYFLAGHLPADRGLRDRVLLALMGSPDRRQIDGIGGADPLTSKVAVVSPSERDDADVDYLFAQVVVDDPTVDVTPNCGNMLAGAWGRSPSSKAWCPRAIRRRGCASTWSTAAVSARP